PSPARRSLKKPSPPTISTPASCRTSRRDAATGPFGSATAAAIVAPRCISVRRLFRLARLYTERRARFLVQPYHLAPHLGPCRKRPAPRDAHGNIVTIHHRCEVDARLVDARHA